MAKVKLFYNQAVPKSDSFKIGHSPSLTFAYFKQEPIDQWVSLDIVSLSGRSMSADLGWEYISADQPALFPLYFYSNIQTLPDMLPSFVQELRQHNSFAWVLLPADTALHSFKDRFSSDLYNFELDAYQKYTILDFSNFQPGDLIQVFYDKSQDAFFLKEVILAEDILFDNKKGLIEESCYQRCALDALNLEGLMAGKLTVKVQENSNTVNQAAFEVQVNAHATQRTSTLTSPKWLIDDRSAENIVPDTTREYLFDHPDQFQTNQESTFIDSGDQKFMGAAGLLQMDLQLVYPLDKLGIAYSYITDSGNIEGDLIVLEGLLPKLLKNQELTYGDGQPVDFEADDSGKIRVIRDFPVEGDFIKPFDILYQGNVVFSNVRPLLRPNAVEKITFSDHDASRFSFRLMEFLLEINDKGELRADLFKLTDAFLQKLKSQQVNLFKIDLLYLFHNPDELDSGAYRVFSTSGAHIKYLENKLSIHNHDAKTLNFRAIDPIFAVENGTLTNIGQFNEDIAVLPNEKIYLEAAKYTISTTPSEHADILALPYFIKPHLLIEYCHHNNLTASYCMHSMIKGDFDSIFEALSEELEGYQFTGSGATGIIAANQALQKDVKRILINEVVLLNSPTSPYTAGQWLNAADKFDNIVRRNKVLDVANSNQLFQNILGDDPIAIYADGWPKKSAEDISYLVAVSRFVGFLSNTVVQFIENDFTDIDEIYRALIRAFRFRYKELIKDESYKVHSVAFGLDLEVREAAYGSIQIENDL